MIVERHQTHFDEYLSPAALHKRAQTGKKRHTHTHHSHAELKMLKSGGILIKHWNIFIFTLQPPIYLSFSCFFAAFLLRSKAFLGSVLSENNFLLFPASVSVYSTVFKTLKIVVHQTYALPLATADVLFFFFFGMMKQNYDKMRHTCRPTFMRCEGKNK